MDYFNNKLDIKALKKDESAFRELVGNIPLRKGTKFNPSGLEGDSWVFFRSLEGSYLLQRKSTGQVMDIIGYAKEIGLSINDLRNMFPGYVRQEGWFYE